MSKSTKALIILAIPFILGFFLGMLVSGGLKANDKKAANEDITAQISVNDEPSAKSESSNAADSRAAAESRTASDSESEDESSDSDDVDGTGTTQMIEIIYYAPRLSYAKLFNDINEEHLKVAHSIGLSSVPKTSSDIDTRDLVHIVDNNYYVIDDLRYSVPYLTKGAAQELSTIGKAFADSLKSKKLLDYKLVVSSVLRTEEDVKKLQRSGNPNASDNSSHCYGTTFDITYTRYYRETETSEFMQPYELTKVLGEVLRDQKAANRCIVKYERKEHCFHITSTVR